MIPHEDRIFARIARQKYALWFVPLADDVKHRARRPVRTIVDVASGPGFLVRALSTAFPAARVVGVDRSRTAVAFAKKQRRGRINASFVLGSAYHLPLQSGAADVVTCRDSFHHFEKPVAAIREMWRALRPGGLLYLQDLRRNAPWYLLSRSLSGRTVFERLQVQSVRAAYTKEEMERLLKQAGIVSYRIRTRHLTVHDIRRFRIEKMEQTILRGSFQAHMIVIAYKR